MEYQHHQEEKVKNKQKPQHFTTRDRKTTWATQRMNYRGQEGEEEGDGRRR